MADNTDDLVISISTDQATLRRSIKRIEADLGTLAGSVKRQFDTVGKSIDNSISSSLQKRIESAVSIGTTTLDLHTWPDVIGEPIDAWRVAA